MFLDHQYQSLPTRAAIESHWETISKGIQIIYQEPAPAASANVNVSSETRLWLDHSRSAALGADGYPIFDHEMVVSVSRTLYGLDRLRAFHID